MSAAHTGWVATSATDDATVVNDRLGTQVAKWADRSTPARSAPRPGRGQPGDLVPPADGAQRPRTATARALRQKAMASAGASASRISGAEVDTAATATAIGQGRPPAAGRRRIEPA